VAVLGECLVKAGDLVEVKKNASIISLRGSVGIIVQYLGKALTGDPDVLEHGCSYYEVNIAASGNQILKETELNLIPREERKK